MSEGYRWNCPKELPEPGDTVQSFDGLTYRVLAAESVAVVLQRGDIKVTVSLRDLQRSYWQRSSTP